MIRFPFTSMQQLNLDWIMQQLHKILDFMPLNGSAGDVLQRTADGAAWQPVASISLDIHGLNQQPDDVAYNDELVIYDNDRQGNYKNTVQNVMLQAPVQSVNGQLGDVVLTAEDVDALPDSTVVPTATSDLINDSGFITAATAPVTSVNGQTGAVTISVPAQAVSSVNGQTGAVVLDAADVGALADSYVAPVTSVNGMTGDVTVSGGSFSPVLLWSGTSGTDPASTTPVVADASAYSWILIVWGRYNFLGRNVAWFYPDWANITSYDDNNYLMYSDYLNYQRPIRFYSDGRIQILDCSSYATYGTNSSTTQSLYCNPIAIYGIA